MAKVEVKLHDLIAPTDTVVVSAYDEEGKPQACTLAFYMVSSNKPPCVTIGICVTQQRKTLASMLETNAFVLAFPSADQVAEMDYLGMETGYNADKLAKIGYTTTKAETVNAPIVNEFRLSLECEIVNKVTVGTHMQLTGEVKRIVADDTVLTEDGKINLDKLQPIIYDEEQMRYLRIGEKIADAFNVGEKFMK